MVTTTKNILNIKRVFKILSLCFLLSIKLSAQEKPLLDKTPIERSIALDLFYKSYARFPSTINTANISNFNYGKGKYFYSEGDFRHPQDYKKSNGLGISIASLAPLKNTNWVLFGSLDYLNMRKEDVEVNLSYGIRQYNSPFYFFQLEKGLWNHQRYNFVVTGANKITDKLSLGINFGYDSNFYYRKSDTRNETIALNLKGQLGISYHQNDTNKFSFALGLERYKTSSSLYNKFSQNNSDENYTVYLNTGLGSFLKNISTQTQTIKYIPEVSLQWQHKKENTNFSVDFTAKKGKEEWIDSSEISIGENNVIAQYVFNNYKLYTVFSKKHNSKFKTNTSLKLAYLKGEGDVWQDTLLRFTNNYLTNSFLANLGFDLLIDKSIINHLGFNLFYFNQEKTDLNFAYQLDNSYVTPEFLIGLNTSLTKKVTVFNDFKIGYKHLLNVNHNPFAANNLFVDSVGNPIADYLGFKSISFNNKIGFAINLKKKTTLELSLETTYNASTNHFNSNSDSNSKDYLTHKIGVNLYY